MLFMIQNFVKLKLFILYYKYRCFIVRSVSIREFCSHVNAFDANITNQWLCTLYEHLVRVEAFCVFNDLNVCKFVSWY